ncbi:PrpF domain-containing protein [Streptomyces sp. QL37]|uniref:PrpF domain-containing protein n=1 Tax=Streptomyces sp. QL37 TaxID=2093747 RepID=UPI001374F183|nr:PrpF domain-containing protein [Streptomyces sp. QL37]
MIGHIARAVGAPTATLVLDQRRLPQDEDRLRPLLTQIRRQLQSTGRGDILKFALVAPSDHPLFDLDYRFVQALPGGVDRFDFQGSCGHSILASVVAADSQHWLPRLTPGGRVRVRVLNNGDHVVCEVDEARRRSSLFTVHFLQDAGVSLSNLLLTGNAQDRLLTPDGLYPVSLVSMGNPYVFVDAADLGITSQEELFTAGDGLFTRLLKIRSEAAVLLDQPAESVFPKIAAVGAFQPGRLALRAISVPKWHPSLALTGTTCVAAAAAIPGTVVHDLAQRSGIPRGAIELDTPGGATAATVATTGNGTLDDVLDWVSVSHKLAHLDEPTDLNAFHSMEEPAWQPVAV